MLTASDSLARAVRNDIYTARYFHAWDIAIDRDNETIHAVISAVKNELLAIIELATIADLHDARLIALHHLKSEDGKIEIDIQYGTVKLPKTFALYANHESEDTSNV